MIPGQGRAYYGFFDPVSNASDPLTVFEQPTIDLPETIQFGQRWKRTVDFQDLIDAGVFQAAVAIHFTSEAVVDAHGKLVLPGLGEFPALRVNELNTYESKELNFGLPLPAQHVRNYYWLVKGIGKAVHIISKGGTTAPSDNFTSTAVVLRVFESTVLRKDGLATPVHNLRIARTSQGILLSWTKTPDAQRYCVEAAEDLREGTPWKRLVETTDNFFAEALLSGGAQQFYRIFSLE